MTLSTRAAGMWEEAEEKQGLKCTEPEADLWELLPIIKCLNLRKQLKTEVFLVKCIINNAVGKINAVNIIANSL